MKHPGANAAKEPIVLVAYDSAWPAQFDAERERLRGILGHATPIEHIGSTSVPGLVAKPILDIVIGVSALPEIEAKIPDLEERGYEYVAKFEAELPERRYFRKHDGTRTTVHVHAVVTGGDFWKRHMAFRDHLRAHPAIAQEYAQLKLGLARKHAHDRDAYTDAKSPFIRRVEAQALKHEFT